MDDDSSAPSLQAGGSEEASSTFFSLSLPMYTFLIFGFVVAIDKRQSTPGWLKKPLQRESLPGKAGGALHSQTPAASEQPASSLPATEQQGAKERWQWGRQLAGSYSHKVSDSDL